VQRHESLLQKLRNETVLNVYLGRLEDGEGTLHAAASRGLDADEFIMLAYDIAFLKGDRSSMEREAIRARARPGGENWMSARQAFVAAYSGRLRDARDVSHRAVLQAQQAGQPERASLWGAGAAIRQALFGNKKAAAEWALSALQLSHTREVAYGTALAFAMSGDSARAQALADEMEKRFQEDSSVRFSYAPTIRAVLALNRAEPQRAVELLKLRLLTNRAFRSALSRGCSAPSILSMFAGRLILLRIKRQKPRLSFGRFSIIAASS
jgi:hypothetical protein